MSRKERAARTRKRLQAEAETIDTVQRHMKQQSMTYQRSLKEEVAAYYGLAWKEVDLPYTEWEVLRERYLIEKKRSC